MTLAVVCLASPAYAHTELDNAIPAEGSRLETSPGTIQLTFTEPVDADLASVVVRGPDGQLLSDGPVRQAATGLMQPLVPSPNAGTVKVSYRVISLDGHPVSDTLTFQILRGDPNAQPAEAAPAGSGPAGGDDSDGGTPTGLLAGAVLVVVLIAVGALLARRRRTTEATETPPPPAPTAP